MPKRPKVAVITAAYNAERFLPETMRSVLEQDHEDFEYVVVDDHSSDATFDVAKAQADRDSRVRAIRMIHNGGPGIARNRGVAETTAPYVAFVDSDDYWEHDFLQHMLEALQKCGPGCVGVFCHSTVVRADGIPTGEIQNPAEGNYDFFTFFRHIFPPGNGSAFLFHRRDFEQAGGFGHLRSMEDLDLYLRVLRSSGSRYFACVPRRLVRYRQMPGGLSRNGKLIEDGWESSIERHIAHLPARRRWVIYYNFSRFYGPRAQDTHHFGTRLMRRALFSRKAPSDAYRHFTSMLLPAMLGWRGYLASRRFCRKLLTAAK